ncbi:MAG: transglycosylase domain-containing protein [Solirubrobacterales bacterium]|nr:transglycosylase domain-containing protein [Solirubrobacterales bacterium]
MSDPTGLQLVPPPEDPPPPRVRPRVKKLRLLAILIPLSLLAIVSTVFGMMMAVASDLPSLETLPQVAKRKNSVLLDVHGTRLATLTSNQGRVIVNSDQIGTYAKYAVIAVEDERFYQNSGVDLRGIARAFFQDVVQRKAVQGGSTITQQFVKNALKAQDQRTVFQKLRESALAYHLTRKWSKERILTEYLNSVYFGNGAYGIEAAARTYFGADVNHEGCGVPGRMCAKELEPHEAALLAAIIASPTGFDPVAHPEAARRRRDMVLRKMLDQGRITQAQFNDAVAQPLYSKLRPPRLQTKPGTEYFVSWVRQSLVDQVGPRRAFEGNLRVYTTLDWQLQQAAQQAVNTYLSWPQGPTAALVALDNKTGEVRAMVGGRDYEDKPFNLATQGQRQPGSSIKPFIMAEALRQGIGPGSVWPSRKREFTVPNTKGREKFVVNNFEDSYAGQSTMANALTFSDNSVFAAIGIQIGTKKVARLANRMGIRTPISTNYAMTLGGLNQGVTPLDMAHAYETFATGGLRVSGTFGTAEDGPVGIDRIEHGDDEETRNEPRRKRVLSRKVAELSRQLLTGPVKYGSARRAQYGGFAAGKTGTTENAGDAWFVGFTDRWTIAVWVGYPDTLKPMKTEFRGEEVTGGSFPALIWHDFVIAANKVYDARANKERAKKGLPPKDSNTTTDPTPTPAAPPPASVPAVPQEGSAPAPGTTTPQTQQPAPEPQQTQPAQPAPDPTPQPTPQPTPTPATPPPSGGTTGGTGGEAATGGTP